LKKLFGTILHSIASGISMVFDFIIGIVEIIVNIVLGIAKGFAAIISMGGCFLIFLLAGPFGAYFLFNPVTILLILFFVIFPILGTKFVSLLKYIKYIITEYLFDRADALKLGKEATKSFDDYGNKYKRMEEEKYRKEQYERQQEQQRVWEERFKQWNEYQNQQRGSQNYGGGYYGGQTYTNPSSDFKKKFENSCDILGLSYDADVYQIKLAYRKKAKQYHPDINKASDATKRFQEINEAYEFLNESNIERYKSLR